MSFICEFCGNVFTSVNNLRTHIKSAKYCISQRNIPLPKYVCSCGKTFTRHNNLKRHITGCLVKKEEEKEKDVELEELRKYKEDTLPLLSELEELRRCKILMSAEDEKLKRKLKTTKETSAKRIKELEDEISKLNLRVAEDKGEIKVYKERPGLVQYINPKLVNIKCDTIAPFTIEYVKKEIDAGKYAYENYIRGEKGLVDFIAGLIAEDDQRSYVCTDTSRNKFHRLIETREWKEDNGANFLNNIFDTLKEPATEYYQKITNMYECPEEQETGDFLMDKTKKMFFGIAHPKSKDRTELFNRIRSDVRKLAAV